MDLNENTINMWHPIDIFSGKQNAALIILNQPITKENESKLISLWRNSTVRFCVDGGTNRLHEWQQQRSIENSTEFVPDYICGDLDSISDATLKHFVAKGTKCVRLCNQDLNDFTKTLRFAVSFVKFGVLTGDEPADFNPAEHAQTQFEQIYCFCDFTGRLDHALANLSTLYDDCLKKVNTYLVSSESITFLLRKGINIIYVNSENDKESPSSFLGKYCGFFPLAKSATVTTRGLKWNLNSQVLKFGSFVSSSNEFDFKTCQTSHHEDLDSNCLLNIRDASAKEHVFIQTDEDLLWTMSIE